MAIVHSQAPVILVGGAPIEKENLLQAVGQGAGIVAADSGAVAVLAAGLMPDAVIGDFDSLPDSARDRLPADRLHHIPDQDSTDFEKCLTRIEAPLVVAVGFSGARLDHELAVFNTLLKIDAPPCVILRGAELAFVAPRDLSLDVPPGTAIAFFPLRPLKVTTRGVRWPLADAVMEPGGLISTSNTATGQVELTSDRRGVLVTLPAAFLGQICATLAAPAAVRAG